jgi:hypothetical protein
MKTRPVKVLFPVSSGDINIPILPTEFFACNMAQVLL